MNTPTPNPRPAPEQHVVDRRIVASALFNAEDEHLAVEPGGFVLDEEHYLDLAEVALGALDLPARDARIRAEALREAAKVLPAYVFAARPVALTARLNEMADQIERDGAGKGFPLPPEPSAVPVEGSGHPQPATGEMWCVCGAPDSGPCGRCVPDTGRPVLSLDTPEGATTDAG